MIPDLGRRYFLFSGTPRGKRIIVLVIIGVAVVMDLTSMTLIASGHNSLGVVTLSSVSAGLMIAAVFLILTNRRPT
jgi:hypothetical protein